MSNARTLDTYNNGVEKYISGTPKAVDGHVKQWLDDLLNSVDKGARILEIGSAFGRDEDYISHKGYDVEMTDGSKGFVEYLRDLGKHVRLLNVLSDDIPVNSYNVVFANAVFLHFNDQEFTQAVTNVYGALTERGRFGLTLKQGEGEEVSQEKMEADRYFKYWKSNEVKDRLRECGFGDIKVEESADGKWLLVIAEKESLV